MEQRHKMIHNRAALAAHHLTTSHIHLPKHTIVVQSPDGVEGGVQLEELSWVNFSQRSSHVLHNMIEDLMLDAVLHVFQFQEAIANSTAEFTKVLCKGLVREDYVVELTD